MIYTQVYTFLYNLFSTLLAASQGAAIIFTTMTSRLQQKVSGKEEGPKIIITTRRKVDGGYEHQIETIGKPNATSIDIANFQQTNESVMERYHRDSYEHTYLIR